MPATNQPASRWAAAGMAGALVLVLVVDGSTAYVRHHHAKPVTVNDAIQKYRADTHHTPTPTATPTGVTVPGVPTPTPSRSGSVPPSVPTSVAKTDPTATVTAAPTTVSPTPKSTTTHQSTRPTSPASSKPPVSTGPTASSSPTAPASPMLPPPGVYSYATTGGERVGVPGGSRDYPKTTTVTVERTGCGIAERWEPSTEHSETRQLCLSGGQERLASFSTKVQFFGVGSTQTYNCGSNAIVYSPRHTLGQPQNFTCSSGKTAAAVTVTPVGFHHLTVAGTSVRTLHIAVSSKLSGDNTGTSIQQLWFTTNDSLLVRNTGITDASQNGVSYHERYSLMLNSLTPQQ